jgi:hypothetical protein
MSAETIEDRLAAVEAAVAALILAAPAQASVVETAIARLRPSLKGGHGERHAFARLVAGVKAD